MNKNYSTCDALPLKDEQIVRDVICAAKINDFWYRVQIGHREPHTNMCMVKFLDYGGYTTVSSEDLRQIRADFMTVPFQAIECVMANIRPFGGKDHMSECIMLIIFNKQIFQAVGERQWSPQASEALAELTRGKTLSAQVAGYTDDGIPEVLLYYHLSVNVRHQHQFNNDLPLFMFGLFSISASCVY